MPKHHEAIEVIAGEPWDIPGTLLDGNGSPIGFAGATSDAAAGTICISVGASDTAGLDTGSYRDGLRVTMPGAGNN